MNYIIETYDNENRQLLGSENSAIVRDAKTMVKVNNRLKWFNPCNRAIKIKISSFTNIYDEKTYKEVKTININH